MQAHIERQEVQRSDSTAPALARERGVRRVIGLTLGMMLLEIGAGYWTGSLALIADGWHMATHVAALGLAAGAYAAARRFSSHRAFAFGTGKIHALAGYTSAIALGFIAVDMVVEGTSRLLRPESIDFVRSLPVAVLGLAVNVASVRMLHQGADARGEHHDPHDHAEHDHNHRAAVAHVLADTFTSALAIVALLAGQVFGWSWLDSLSGVIGGVVVLAWGVTLCRGAALELLNVDPSPAASLRIRAALEAMQDVRVKELRVWPMGRGARGCVMTLSSAAPLDVQEYRRQVLAALDLEHLTIEVHQQAEGGGRTCN